MRAEIEFPEGLMVTVSDVVVGPDLKHARVMVSILPENRTDEALNILAAHRGRIQQDVAGELTMKFSPRISFRPDDSQERASKIDALIDSVRSDS